MGPLMMHHISFHGIMASETTSCPIPLSPVKVISSGQRERGIDSQCDGILDTPWAGGHATKFMIQILGTLMPEALNPKLLTTLPIGCLLQASARSQQDKYLSRLVQRAANLQPLRPPPAPSAAPQAQAPAPEPVPPGFVSNHAKSAEGSGLIVPGQVAVEQHPVPEPTVPPIPGSVGHPLFCRRPCVFIARGNCPDGTGCFFCHEQHTSQYKPSRRERETLRSSNFPSKLLLLRSCLHTKARRLPPGAPSLENLCALVEAARMR